MSTSTPDPTGGPRALLSPDGKLIAWRTGAKRVQWRATDGYDRMPEDVADWTPLVPAVSPTPDTEALRQQVARMLIDVAHDFGHARSVMVDTAVAADALLKLVAEREAGLRADLGQTRAERDKFADLHRGEARTHDETIASLNAARAEVERLRGIETASAGLVELVKQCGGWPDTGLRSHFEQLQELRADVERLTAELARVSGARPIPDDAVVDRAALRLLRVHVYGTLPKERYDASARKQWTNVLDEDDRETWRKLARELLADLGAAPTMGPAPAAADGTCGCATCNPGSPLMYLCARCGNKRCPSAASHANECTGSNATGQAGSLYEHVNSPSPTRCAGCNAADEFWCSCPDGYEPPAAPQAPAEPTELPSSLLAATLANLGITQAELARRTGISTKHINHVIKGKAGLGVELANALADATGVPADRWLHAEANRLSRSAAREDTAPPDVHLVTVGTEQHEDYFVARCNLCGLVAGDSDERWVQDRADAHRADTLRPANPTPEEKQ